LPGPGAEAPPSPAVVAGAAPVSTPLPLPELPCSDMLCRCLPCSPSFSLDGPATAASWLCRCRHHPAHGPDEGCCPRCCQRCRPAPQQEGQRPRLPSGQHLSPRQRPEEGSCHCAENGVSLGSCYGQGKGDIPQDLGPCQQGAAGHGHQQPKRPPCLHAALSLLHLWPGAVANRSALLTPAGGLPACAGPPPPPPRHP